ncbi:hypothetical protein QYE76_054113 [Lolium multiflorum]|uniref:Retrotransposon gag domain-containing protein n=1 Tax=Lolium multiflorum TaxID=4521 RepID=A0AAD8SY69_LOLMU|nr:hypothetical protein QYE76_054113 [Lolium multiflorum]
MFPCPRINEVLPPVASAVVISTTVAPTVGHGTSSLRAAARPYSPIRRQVATGRMIATGGFFHIQPSSYRPASTPLARAWMVPVGTINLFVGLTGVSDPGEIRPSQVHDPFAPGQLLTATLPLTGEVHTEAEPALEDDADSAAAASTAESIAAASVAGSIVAASLGDSITPVSNPSDFEDDSVLPLFSSDSDSDSVDAAWHRHPTAVFMAAGEGDQPPQDPFSTPLPPTATAVEIEAHRAALEEQRKRELVERQKFRLEQDSVRAVSHYRNERNRARMERIQAQGFPSARLNFDDPDGEVRVARPTNPDIPESSRAAAGGVAHGAPPPPPPPPGGRPPPQAEVDANGLRLHSSPADNVAAAQAALANLPETGEGAIFVQHAKALVAKALEQQHAAADSQGRLYSRSSASRAASSATANRAIVNVNNCPPPAPRAAHSTNHRVEPRPARAMVAANGQAIDARTHILNDQEWRARNRANDRFADEAPRQSAFNRVGPACFGPMIRGEPYPVGFKGPRDIEKYDTHIDPTVWIDSYTMAMGILGYSELLAARYLPLMMDGVNLHWFNTLTPNSIDSWDDARAAFIQHFASAYTRATTIEDLDRCVQGPRESTRRWVQRWQDMWTTSNGISTDTAIYCFRRCCRYEPLSAKLRVSRDNISIAELFDIALRYADEDPTVDSDDEYGQRRNRRPTSDNRRSDYRFSGRSSGGKRRADGGHTELVANADYEQRDPKSFRRDNRAPREDRPQPRRFDARSLLDAPCIYHSREGKPSNHTTGNCYSLKQIERARRAKEANGGNQQKDRAKDQDQSKEDGFGRSAGSLHTFTGVGDRRDRKVLNRAVAVHAVSVGVPRWLNWSEQSITWSCDDHAPRIEYPGRVALVVRPKVADYWLPKTLMDGGSSINIMYYETFQRLGLPDSRLEDTKVTFHGIVPGRKAFPIGKVTLPVTFGTPVNYRTERITFEVVNFRSPYHCVLGRQAFATFMAAPHYAYNMMKMPGPRGIITVHGDPAMALECEDDSAKLADAVITEELDNNAELAKYPVDSNDPAILEKPTELDSPAATFKPTTDTRQVDLVENDSSRQVTIGTGLSAQ